MKPATGSAKRSAMDGQKLLRMALLLGAALLGGILFWEWQQGLQLERDLRTLHKTPTRVAPTISLLSEFGLPAQETGFPELLARPLFTISRRFPVVPQGGPSAMKKGQFVLVGVLLARPQQAALLRDVQTNKTKTVAVGARVRDDLDMVLEKVAPDRVVLRQGEEVEELTLDVLRGGKPAQPPPAPVVGQSNSNSNQVMQAPPAFKPTPTPTVPRPLTPEEIAIAEKRYQENLDELRKKGLPPPSPPPWRNPGK